ncbi:MAG: transketolase C-terminal domain-containing protein [Candidatus Dormiibacterota bacterium]
MTTIETTYRQAVRQAIHDEMAADRSVVLLGEDVGAAGGVFKATEELFGTFGGDRVRDTPISEQAIVGLAMGAAIRGMRPVVDLMFADFVAVAMDQLAIEIPKYRYMTGGQATLPLVVRAAAGAGLGFGSQHSGCPEAWFMHVPGWRVVTPATPQDAYSLLRAAIRSDDPVLVFEHKALYARRGTVDTELRLEIGKANALRDGEDLTIVANLMMVERALAAADQLAAAGISAAVVDLRGVAPLDVATVAASVRRTGRLLTVEESPGPAGWGAELLARIAEEELDSLDQVRRLSGPPTPIPYAPNLEAAWIPSTDAVVRIGREMVQGTVASVPGGGQS